MSTPLFLIETNTGPTAGLHFIFHLFEKHLPYNQNISPDIHRIESHETSKREVKYLLDTSQSQSP